MTETRRSSAHLQLLFIALIFFGPLIVAAWLYYSGYFNAPARSNHGVLLEPIINLRDDLPGSALLAEHEGQWLLVYTEEGPCGGACRDALYTLRQSRLMLGKERDRLQRAFLHGPTPPDKVFIADEHAGLVTTRDTSLGGLLTSRKPTEIPGGGFYLIDPLGNLVMYFPPDMNPSEMVDDLKHLLRLSRIG